MKLAITFDVDWAPDFAIDCCAELLAEQGVKSTWFVTHQSPAVERLRSRPDLFELGIHPNFMPKSSHGSDPEQVLCTCMEFVPEAVSVRMHGLLQSGNILDLILSRTPIKFDVSLFHPRARNIEVIKYERFGKVLWRIPYVWEDDYVMESSVPEVVRDHEFAGFARKLLGASGPQIFNFHPIHVFLNSNRMGRYNAMKEFQPQLMNLTAETATPFVDASHTGTKNALIEIAKAVSNNGGGAFVRDLHY